MQLLVLERQISTPNARTLCSPLIYSPQKWRGPTLMLADLQTGISKDSSTQNECSMARSSQQVERHHGR